MSDSLGWGDLGAYTGTPILAQLNCCDRHRKLGLCLRVAAWHAVMGMEFLILTWPTIIGPDWLDATVRWELPDHIDTEVNAILAMLVLTEVRDETGRAQAVVKAEHFLPVMAIHN